jgi:hypothetical protein
MLLSRLMASGKMFLSRLSSRVEAIRLAARRTDQARQRFKLTPASSLDGNAQPGEERSCCQHRRDGNSRTYQQIGASWRFMITGLGTAEKVRMPEQLGPRELVFIKPIAEVLVNHGSDTRYMMLQHLQRAVKRVIDLRKIGTADYFETFAPFQRLAWICLFTRRKCEN